MDVNTAKDWIRRHAEGTALETDPHAYVKRHNYPTALADRIARSGAYDGVHDTIVAKNMRPAMIAHEIGHANQKHLPVPVRFTGTELFSHNARNAALGSGALGFAYGKATGNEELANKSRNASLVAAALLPLPHLLIENHADRFGNKVLQAEGMKERINTLGVGRLAKRSYAPVLAAGGIYGLIALLERKKKQREKVAHITVPQVKGPSAPKIKGVQNASKTLATTTRQPRGMARLGTGNNTQHRGIGTIGGGNQQGASFTN